MPAWPGRSWPPSLPPPATARPPIRQRIEWAESIEHASQELRRRYGANEPGSKSEEHDTHISRKDAAEDIGRSCPEGDADTDLAGALTHRVREHAKHADCRQAKCEETQHRRRQRREGEFGELGVELVAHGSRRHLCPRLEPLYHVGNHGGVRWLARTHEDERKQSASRSREQLKEDRRRRVNANQPRIADNADHFERPAIGDKRAANGVFAAP